jgi:hypothetical protein
MIKKTSGLILIYGLVAVLGVQSNQNPQQKALVLAHVTVMDATGAPAQPDMTVVISSNRITSIGQSGNVRVPTDAQVVDATGKFLIPGLWDMHGHTTYKEFLALFVANGITGVRDMGGSPNEFEMLSQWRRQIADGTLIGPRIIAAGIIVDGPKPTGRPDSINVANASQARQAVDSLKQRGANFVKVYSMLPPEAYFAIADEAKKQRFPFAGHVPASVSAVEASDAGQKSMEHVFGILPLCSTNGAELRKQMMAAIAKSGYSVFVQEEISAQVKALDTYDPKRASAVFSRFVKNGTWQVPTLVGWRSLADTSESHVVGDSRLKYIPPERRERWKATRAGFLRSLPGEYLANRESVFQKQRDFVGAMHRAGVKLMAGTDTAALYIYPGFSLHDELALLVKAGLTPMEALQAATRNPAEYLGVLTSLGTVQAGKIADLVLLEANPLEDIRNTQKINAVVLAGKLISKPELQEMLAKVQAAFNRN